MFQLTQIYNITIQFFFALLHRSTVGEYNQWYKFNDTHVEKFDMTEETLEQELFGGEYKVPQTEGSKYKFTSFTNFVALHSISRHKLRSGGAVV